MVNAKRGRPIEYNRDLTLQRAADMFWSVGFAGSSLDALSDATQLTRPSLAGAFGDKEALYIATLERYRDASVTGMKGILSGTRHLREELAEVYTKATDIYIKPGDVALGCLLIGTASVEAVHRPAVRRVLRESLSAFNAILEKRIRKAIADGELDASADPAAVASVASAIMHSLAVRARAGEPRGALDKLGEAAVDLICDSAKRRIAD